jgi:hypothetical protein
LLCVLILLLTPSPPLSEWSGDGGMVYIIRKLSATGCGGGGRESNQFAKEKDCSSEKKNEY